MRVPQILIGSYGSDTAPALRLAGFNPATGALTPSDELGGIVNPSFVALHPTAPWFYAVSETGVASQDGPGHVWAGRLESAAGDARLSALNRQPSGGDWPCHLAIDPGGRWLFVANYGSGNMSVLPILSDGALGQRGAHVQHQGAGQDLERQEGPHAHSTTLAPDGFVIVADLGIDALVVYAFDPVTGRLTAHEPVRARPGAGPRHMVFHPSGQRAYVANELDRTLSVYAYGAGRFDEIQVEPTVPPGVGEGLVADIHLSPDATRLYVSNRGHNSLAVFDVAGDGAVTPLGHAHCGGDWPRNFAVAPDGRFVLVANQHSGDVSVLPVLQGTPWLGAPVARLDMPQAACVAFLPPR